MKLSDASKLQLKMVAVVADTSAEKWLATMIARYAREFIVCHADIFTIHKLRKTFGQSTMLRLLNEMGCLELMDPALFVNPKERKYEGTTTPRVAE